MILTSDPAYGDIDSGSRYSVVLTKRSIQDLTMIFKV